MYSESALVLVVDDNEMNRDLLQRRLQRQQYRVETAENGAVALEKMAALPVDIVLLDIMMPVLDGFQVLARMKAHSDWQDVPVIIISAADDMDSIVRGIELGAEDYLPKPYSAPILKARISACLEKKQLRDVEKAYLSDMATMQAIDRELNASLDLARAMALTLGWALRHAGARAGLMGQVADGRFLVRSSSGYAPELSGSSLALSAAPLPAVRQALETRQVVYLPLTGPGLLAGARQQLAVPIVRQADVLALLLLEHDAALPPTPRLRTFLSRLGDHAALAIANAQMYTAVQEANQAKTEFVSVVSHELKTPMTSIKGYADLLLTGDFGPLTDMQQQFLDTIRANVERMRRLVSDLTDISRIEAGHLRLTVAPVPFAEVLDDVVRSARAQADEKGLELVLSVPDDLPPVLADRGRLEQILANLVSNAVKYTPASGRVAVQVELVTVDEAARPRPALQVAVADTGLGIAPEAQATVFEKFTRADDPEAQKESGTGLGLSITKSLVELQNGRIWFESVFRAGTTFYVTLPVANGEG